MNLPLKNVLMFCFEFAPYNRLGSNIGARRPAGFAHYLPPSGWQPIVICCDASERNTWEKIDHELIESRVNAALLNRKAGQPIIIRIPSLKYANWLDKLWWRLVDVDPVKGTFETSSRWKNLLRKPVSLLKLFMGDHSQSWQQPAMIAAQMLREIITIDCVLAEHGPDAPLFIAAKCNKRWRWPWMTDFRDPVFQPYSGLSETVYRSVITRLTKSCSHIVNVNKYWASLDEADFGKPATAITNGFDPEEWVSQPLEQRIPFSPGIITFFYPGNVYLPYQQTDLFFKLLQELGQRNISFRFVYCGPTSAYIAQKANEYEVADHCSILGIQPREKVFNLYNEADFLVLFPMQDDDSLYYKHGLLPGKFAEYVGAKKPMLCMSNYNSLLEKTIEDTGVGLVYNHAAVAAAFFENDNWVEKLPIRDEALCRSYARDETTRQLAAVLNSIAVDKNQGSIANGKGTSTKN